MFWITQWYGTGTDHGKKWKTAILLPGPPNELYPLFEGQVFPYLEKRQNSQLVSHMVKICGYGESQVEDKILDLIVEKGSICIDGTQPHGGGGDKAERFQCR